MTAPVKLETLTTKPDSEVVAALEDALLLAKEGTLREVAIYGNLTGNRFYTNTKFADGITLVGALERAKWEIMRGLDHGV